MRIRSVLFFVFITIMSSSCGFKQKLVIQDFYTKVSVVNDSLDKLTTQWHTLRDQASISKNYAALSPARIELGAFISRARSAVANIPVVPELEKVKNEEDALLQNQSTMVAEVYPAFEQFNEYTPKDVVDKSVSQITNDLLDEKAKTASIKKMLADLAKKNDLKK